MDGVGALMAYTWLQRLSEMSWDGWGRLLGVQSGVLEAFSGIWRLDWVERRYVLPKPSIS